MPGIPQCPGEGATREQAEAYIKEVEAYQPTQPSDPTVCDIIREAYQCIRCDESSPPWPDLCARLEALNQQNNCDPL